MLTLHQVKVLVLYTVDGIPGPLPRHVVETSLALCDANIFSVQEALYDLIANENLTQSYDEDGTAYLFLTSQGKLVIDNLRKDAPNSYRERVLAYAAVEMSKLRAQIGVEASVVPTQTRHGQEYTCNVSIADQGELMMSVSLFAPNKLQADMMAERFRKQPLDVYRKILQILTGTDKESEEKRED